MEILMDGLPYETWAHVQFTGQMAKRVHRIFLDQLLDLLKKR